VHPIISDGVYAHRNVNVEAQRRDPDSLLNWMVRMVRQRKECPEIGWGTWSILPVDVPGVLVMSYEWRHSRLVVLHNFRPQPCEVRLRVPGEHGDRLVNLLHEQESVADERGEHLIAVEELGYRWFRVGGLGYALERTRDGG
jgi:maltose alpha-D-glucosyltransferase / alpha-amylase